MEQLQWVVLQAAVRHVQRPEFKGDKYEGVLYYVLVAATQFQGKGRYTISFELRNLHRRLLSAKAVAPVHKELRLKFANNSTVEPAEAIPVSNTGITPTQASILEEFVNGR